MIEGCQLLWPALAWVPHTRPHRLVFRGECGLEIVACLLALKLRHPDRVFLLRGNHECTEITVMFGFCMECQRRSTLAVWEAAMQAFDALPLAALLGRHVLCVHGGISPQLGRLSDINGIQRPTDVNPAGAGLLVDLLWADPCTHTAGVQALGVESRWSGSRPRCGRGTAGALGRYSMRGVGPALPCLALACSGMELPVPCGPAAQGGATARAACRTTLVWRRRASSWRARGCAASSART